MTVTTIDRTEAAELRAHGKMCRAVNVEDLRIILRHGVSSDALPDESEPSIHAPPRVTLPIAVVPTASISALCDEVARLRAELATRAPEGYGDLAELIEATSYQLDPYQWTAEYMDEQHWIGVQSVMPRIDELLDRCTAAEAGHASAAAALVEARTELAKARDQPAGTVGDLLATLDVHGVIEFNDEHGNFRQIAVRVLIHHRLWCGDEWSEYGDGSAWCDEEIAASWLKCPARLVPADQADSDPATRGQL